MYPGSKRNDCFFWMFTSPFRWRNRWQDPCENSNKNPRKLVTLPSVDPLAHEGHHAQMYRRSMQIRYPPNLSNCHKTSVSKNQSKNVKNNSKHKPTCLSTSFQAQIKVRSDPVDLRIFLMTWCRGASREGACRHVTRKGAMIFMGPLK